MPALNSPGTRVVLIGTQTCENEERAPDVPAVQSTMDDLADVLMRRGEVPAEQITRILDPDNPMRLGLDLADAVDQAKDVLLLHFVGHGFLSDDGELYLATRATDPSPGRLEHSAMPYQAIRRSVQNSPARAIIIILDCCFSGRAANALSGVEPGSLADVYGAFVLTSSARDQTSIARPEERHTAFTGELIALLDQGDPGGPPHFSMRHIHSALIPRLEARGLPLPRQMNEDRIDDMPLVPNIAVDSTPKPPPVNGAINAPRRRSRMLPVVLAVLVVVLGGGWAVWFGPLAGVAEPEQGSLSKEPGPPGDVPKESPPPETPPKPEPPLTACADRASIDGCGKIPGGATSLDADGTLVTLISSSANTVLRYSQDKAGAELVGPVDLGARVEGDPVVVPDARGWLAGFAISGGQLWYSPHVDLDVPGQAVAWTPISDKNLRLVGTPAAAQDNEGKIMVFARDASGGLWQIGQNSPGQGNWVGPLKHSEATLASDPTIHIDRNDCLRVFALGDDTIVHTWAQAKRGRNVWGHTEITGYPVDRGKEAGSGLATSPAIALDENGSLHFWALGTDDHLWHTVESDEKPNVWQSGWDEVPGRKFTEKPVAVADRLHTISVFAHLRDVSSRVVYDSVAGNRFDSGKSGSIAQLMARIYSVTLDRNGALVVTGLHNQRVQTAYRVAAMPSPP